MLYFNNLYSLVSQNNEKYYLLNKVSREKIQINNDLFNLLSMISDDNSILSKDKIRNFEQQNWFKRLLDLNVLTDMYQERLNNIFFQKENTIDTLFIEISKKCNLRCLHCYNESLFSQKDIIDFKTIEDLIYQAKSLGVHTIQITGGEPLIQKDIMEIAHMLYQYGFSISIFTNLTLLKDEMVPKIKKMNINIITSLDYFKSSSHDAFRGARGAYFKTVKSIKILKKNNIPIRVNMMIDGKSEDEIQDLVNFLKLDLGVNYVADIIIPIGRAEKTSINHLKEVSSYYKKIAIDQWTSEKPLNLAETNICSSSCIYSNDCGVNRNFLFIDYLGNAILCPSLRKEYSEDFFFGNIFEENLSEIFNNFFSDNLNVNCHKLNDCKFKEQCLGGCRSRAFHFTKSINGIDPVMCNVYNLLEENINEVF